MSNFSFSHSVFKRLVSQRRQKVSLCGNRLKQAFENVMGKGENASNRHFLHCLQCFLPFQNKCQSFGYIYFVICKFFEFGQVQNVAIWERVNNLCKFFFYELASHTISCHVWVLFFKSFASPCKLDANKASCSFFIYARVCKCFFFFSLTPYNMLNKNYLKKKKDRQR